MDIQAISAIAQVVEQAAEQQEQQRRAEFDRQQQEKEAHLMALLKERVQKEIEPEILEAMGPVIYSVSISQQTGFLLFDLPDEDWEPEGFQFMFRLDARQDIELRIPKLVARGAELGTWLIGQNLARRPDGITTAYEPIPGSTWGQTLAYFAAKWVQEIEQNRQTLADRQAAQSEADARAQAEAEARRARLEAEATELAALRAEEAEVIEALGDAVGAIAVWPAGAVVTLYRWEWCKGVAIDPDSEEPYFDYDEGLSLGDLQDPRGYVRLMNRNPQDRLVKLLPDIHKPVVTKIVLTGMDDLKQIKGYRLREKLPVTVTGASVHSRVSPGGMDGDPMDETGETFWLWGDEGEPLEQTIEAPVGWLRLLLGTPDRYSVIINRP